MKKFWNSCIRFFKKETVFCVAAFVAVISMFFVTPSAAYLDYIDFHVLALLLALMLVVAGFQSVGLFDKILPVLIQKSGNTRMLSAILIMIRSSMNTSRVVQISQSLISVVLLQSSQI